MKTVKVWRVMHHQNERGDLKRVRYVATEDVAKAAAKKPWAFCGAQGEAEEATIVIYDTLEEIVDAN
jgi:hypothetical protein